MEFEFDPEKSAANLAKHGIDFEEAQALWGDPFRVEVPARTVGEARWLLVGRVNGLHWSAIVTYRGDIVRIVSVRRSRVEEVKLYEADEH